MLLLPVLLPILQDWQKAFPQRRSHLRAMAQCLGALTAFGRRTLSRAIWAIGRQQRDWSADYRLHARSPWRSEDLFQPILQRALPFCGGRHVAVAIDDTRLHKTGRRILTASWQRDPLSPKFRINLMFGLRFLQLSLLVPLYRRDKACARGLPVRFEEVPVVKRPRRNAAAALWSEYRQALRQRNLSQRALEVIRGLRAALDQAGAGAKRLLMVGDGSFCNRTLFRAQLDRVDIIARARRDLRLCQQAGAGSRCFYDPNGFTPEQVRLDEARPWKKVRIFYAGQWRRIRYKEVSGVYWRTGARRRALRLLVIEGLSYRSLRRLRRQEPAFLLSTALIASVRELVQAYFDRWQIEVNHREEKDTLGVGQAQLRSSRSVSRQPAFVVAGYSALLLAALIAFGPSRQIHCYEPLPKWRRNASRPSCLDLVTLLRKELAANPASLAQLGIAMDWKSLGLAAAA